MSMEAEDMVEEIVPYLKLIIEKEMGCLDAR